MRRNCHSHSCRQALLPKPHERRRRSLRRRAEPSPPLSRATSDIMSPVWVFAKATPRCHEDFAKCRRMVAEHSSWCKPGISDWWCVAGPAELAQFHVLVDTRLLGAVATFSGKREACKTWKFKLHCYSFCHLSTTLVQNGSNRREGLEGPTTGGDLVIASQCVRTEDLTPDAQSILNVLSRPYRPILEDCHDL